MPQILRPHRPGRHWACLPTELQGSAVTRLRPRASADRQAPKHRHTHLHPVELLCRLLPFSSSSCPGLPVYVSSRARCRGYACREQGK